MPSIRYWYKSAPWTLGGYAACQEVPSTAARMPLHVPVLVHGACGWIKSTPSHEMPQGRGVVCMHQDRTSARGIFVLKVLRAKCLPRQVGYQQSSCPYCTGNITLYCAYTCHKCSISTSSNAREEADMPSAADLTAGPPYRLIHTSAVAVPVMLMFVQVGYTVLCWSMEDIAISMLCGWHQQGQATRGAQAEPPRRNKPLAPLGLCLRELAFAFCGSGCKGAKIHRATPTGQPNTELALIRYWH